MVLDSQVGGPACSECASKVKNLFLHPLLNVSHGGTFPENVVPDQVQGQVFLSMLGAPPPLDPSPEQGCG